MRRLLPVFLCAALGAPAPCDGHPPLDLAAVEALRRDDAERRRAALDLAALELDAVAAGLFREGPALSVSAGPRFSPGATVSDLAAGVDVPVAFETRPSREAARLLRERAGEVVSASELSARQRLRAAYAEAWLALERAALLDAQVRLVEEWVETSARRAEAGAEAPYQVRLAEGDLLAARSVRDRARGERAAAWSALRERAAVPQEPVPISPPPSVPLGDLASARARFEAGLLARGLAGRRAIVAAAAERETALASERFSLAASAAKEGEESVARLGLTYRLPLGGERTARDRRAAAVRATLEAEAAAERVALEGRLVSALSRAEGFGEVPDPARFAEALAAVGQRLAEGKETPASAVQLRRQLVEASLLALERRRDAFLLADEIDVLTRGRER